MQEPQEKLVQSLGQGDPLEEETATSILLQYSFLENPMEREVSGATVYGVAKSWTRLSMHVH